MVGIEENADDGVACTLDFCDENDGIVNLADNDLCGVGETCDVVDGCVGGTTPAPINLGGFKIKRTSNSSGFFNIPANTLVPVGGYLVISKNATKTNFERAPNNGWGTLPAGTVYVQGNNITVINANSNTYALTRADDTVVDGPTRSTTEDFSYHRSSLTGDVANQWTSRTIELGSPGSGATITNAASGCYISEVSDATGTRGGSTQEFIEIHCTGAVPAATP